MDKDKVARRPKPAEKGEIEDDRSKREETERDEALDEYDKAIADSFPASDPPAMP